MVDASHLERMGRELECPICLSLLNSAASLTCNHVFCGSCIAKSMKSVSSCPVCKVPFRPREIRPARHMDNLVSIYKSMEVASGVNILVTQAAPSTKLSDHENQHDGDNICALKEHSNTSTETAAEEYQERCKKKRCKASSKVKLNTCVNANEPSFPTKKRVHVPQFPPSGTPRNSIKSNNEIHETDKREPERSSKMQEEKLIYNKNEDPAFTPFFWLGDDDEAEKVTQQTDGDLIMETPPDVPSFSDIKDSDDEIACKKTPKRGTCIASSEADFFDSEMFEWTQRACSPEIYSSPMRMQVVQEGNAIHCGVQERNGYVSEHASALLESSFENRDIMMYEKETDEPAVASSSFPRHIIVSGENEKFGKRGRRAIKNSKTKGPKRTVLGASGYPKELEKVNIQHMQKLTGERNSSDEIKKSSERKRKVAFDASATEAVSENYSSLPDTVNHPADMSALSNARKCRRNVIFSEGVSSHKGLCPNSEAEAAKMKAAKDSMSQKQCENLISHFHKRSSPKEKDGFNNGMVIQKCKVRPAKKKKDLKRVKSLEEKKSEILVCDSQSQGITRKITSEDTQKLGVYRNSSGRHISNSLKVNNPSCFPESILDKIEKGGNSIVCAFCQSAEESEATGLIVHYLEGKPVEGDQIGGSDVIHSHKNCTEWAPNVFFQDDKAINLESELARSRRIKCSFCGIKGAALGCYEKSCRKSFHVPCAKITPECRWDHDNFVMLCPLHVSFKLPCEVHVSQINWKKKSIPGRLAKDESKSNQPWKSHMQIKNLVLCCSGLTDIERGIISEFEKFFGVKIMKNWDQRVTHIIASTDNNGACKRTLKFLMGVLEGKWILSTEWVQACINCKGLVDERHYEVEVDVHGIRDGPNLGRLRLLNKKPKLFNGFKFYFLGEFVPSYKKYLHDLVITGGGTILNRKPISENHENSSECFVSTTFIIYSLELHEKCEPMDSVLHRRRMDAEALANSTGAVAVSNSWILDSIAGCKLQNFSE